MSNFEWNFKTKMIAGITAGVIAIGAIGTVIYINHDNKEAQSVAVEKKDSKNVVAKKDSNKETSKKVEDSKTKESKDSEDKEQVNEDKKDSTTPSNTPSNTPSTPDKKPSNTPNDNGGGSTPTPNPTPSQPQVDEYGRPLEYASTFFVTFDGHYAWRATNGGRSCVYYYADGGLYEIWNYDEQEAEHNRRIAEGYTKCPSCGHDYAVEHGGINPETGEELLHCLDCIWRNY